MSDQPAWLIDNAGLDGWPRADEHTPRLFCAPRRGDRVLVDPARLRAAAGQFGHPSAQHSRAHERARQLADPVEASVTDVARGRGAVLANGQPVRALLSIDTITVYCPQIAGVLVVLPTDLGLKALDDVARFEPDPVQDAPAP